MKKEEFIAKYGEEAYAKMIENTRLKNAKRAIEDPEWYKKRLKSSAVSGKNWIENNREKFNKLQLNSYHKNKQDAAYREKYLEKQRRAVKKYHESLGDAANFINAQYRCNRKVHLDNWEQYTLDLLANEANNVDGDVRLLNEDFLYERFIDNKQNEMFYGNLQVLKYFVLLMCLKVYRDEPFSAQNIEMIKYFDSLENTTKKKPIVYNSNPLFLPKEYVNNKEKATTMMLLYNLSADFMHNRNRYPTDKKLY